MLLMQLLVTMISLNIRNSSGPNTEPYGTENVNLKRFDTTIYYNQYSLCQVCSKRFTNYLFNPKLKSLDSRTPWSNRSDMT